MANVAGVSEEIERWLATTDPDAACVLPLTAHELGMLHLAMELVQELLERLPDSGTDPEAFGPVRLAIERLLVKGGYGGSTKRVP